MYEGQYVTRQHVELLERQKEAKVAAGRLGQHIWSGCGAGSPAGGKTESPQARARDPSRSAIRPPPKRSSDMLRREDDPGTEAAVDRSRPRDSTIGGGRCAGRLSLTDPDPELRHQCLEYLIKSGRPGAGHALHSRAEEPRQRNRQPGRRGARPDRRPRCDRPAHRRPGDEAQDQDRATATRISTPTRSPEGGGFSFGGGGPKFVTQDARKTPTCSAHWSRSSGGTSFDYDQAQWRRWLAAQAKQQRSMCAGISEECGVAGADGVENSADYSTTSTTAATRASVVA